MNTTRVRQALEISRGIISDHIEEIEENSCLHDNKTHKPIIESMDDMAKPDYRRCLRAVRLIDETLKEFTE